MSQKNEQTPEAAASLPERVGDLLHKERITRRITIEMMAKDLKLNVSYIKSIEANNFDDLPAEPYIRVYLRSIAAYLNLDPEEIIRSYFTDKGEHYQIHSGNASEKIRMSTIKEAEQQKVPWIPIAIIGVILAVLIVISSKGGLITAGTEPTPINSDSVKAIERLNDSVIATDDTTVSDSAIPGATDSAIAPSKSDSLRIALKAITSSDSLWAYVFTDGARNFAIYKKGDAKSFAARDSIDIYVRHSEKFLTTLNGKEIDLVGDDYTAVRIKASGMITIKPAIFKAIYKGRL